MLPENVQYCFGGAPARRLKTVKVAPIVARYRDRYNFDAAPCFAGLDEIGLYECPETQVRFYYPFETAGPEALYQQLQTFDWNYKDVKWEHDVALSHVRPCQRVLDVGCGQGSFLARAGEKGAVPTGIEFNRDAGERARAKGVEILPMLLADHARERPEYYDVVTSFQVLEHVTNPREFLEGSLHVLKPGGTLIVGVPNDDGFLGQDGDAVLNMPPHHMSLWTRRSLEALTRLLPVKLDCVEFEPLQELDWYQAVMERRFLTGVLRRRLYYRLGFNRLFRQFIDENAHTIDGHTVLAVFTKSAVPIAG